jgi:hypothetical protein
MERFEQKCKQLLVDSRPETGGDETTIDFQLPRQLLGVFGRITIFLLCAVLAVSRHAVSADTINLARDKVDESLRESEGILLRLTEHTEIDLDQIGDESIRTADTLLVLILENALQISCREQDDDISCKARQAHFDLEDTYSRYTTRCVRTIESTVNWHVDIHHR